MAYILCGLLVDKTGFLLVIRLNSVVAKFPFVIRLLGF